MSTYEQGPVTGDVEIVGAPVRERTGSSRRYVTAFVVAALGAGAVGAGVWAWQAWADQGAQPAEALPANTLAYAALDLDPPGRQKVAAYNTLRKFPSMKKDLGLDSADDLTKSVVDGIASDNGCDFDYGDVKAWIGDRVAVAAVKQARIEPVFVFQVKDADRARTGLRTLGRACDGDGFGYAVDGDWAVLARNDDVAAQVQKDAARGSLDDDKEFRALTEAAGDPGLATLYAAPRAGKALLDETESDPFAIWSITQMLTVVLDPFSSYFGLAGMAISPSVEVDEGESSSHDYEANVSPDLLKQEERLNKRFEHFDELSEPEQRRLMRQHRKLMEKMYGPMDGGSIEAEDDFSDEYPTPELDPALRDALQSFTGLGGVARFADSGLEVEIVGDDLKGAVGDMYAGSSGRDLVSPLPADSAIAYGAGLADGWVDALMKQFNQLYVFTDSTPADAAKAFEKATGLDVPGDLEALGGEGISLVAGSGLDVEDLYLDPAKAPVAVRLTGDADRIDAALDKLRTKLGSGHGPKLVSRHVGDDVLVGVNAAYLDEVAKGGDDLGDSDVFRKVVPDADKATSVYFMDFDAGDWLAKSVGSGDRKDVEALQATGLTVTKDKGTQHVLFRLSFDD